MLLPLWEWLAARPLAIHFGLPRNMADPLDRTRRPTALPNPKLGGRLSFRVLDDRDTHPGHAFAACHPVEFVVDPSTVSGRGSRGQK